MACTLASKLCRKMSSRRKYVQRFRMCGANTAWVKNRAHSIHFFSPSNEMDLVNWYIYIYICLRVSTLFVTQWKNAGIMMPRPDCQRPVSSSASPSTPWSHQLLSSLERTTYSSNGTGSKCRHQSELLIFGRNIPFPGSGAYWVRAIQNAHNHKRTQNRKIYYMCFFLNDELSMENIKATITSILFTRFMLNLEYCEST